MLFPFYQSLGFIVMGEKQTVQGISSIPMKRCHAIIVKKRTIYFAHGKLKMQPHYPTI